MRRCAVLLGVTYAVFALSATPSGADSNAHYMPGQTLDLSQILPGPPVARSLADRVDRATFRSTRALSGSARWQQAIGDVDESVPALLADFSAAAGRKLSRERTPMLASFLVNIRQDVAVPVDAAKAHFQRPRPFFRDHGPVCQPMVELSGSFDYPSGHTSWGTTVSLILAELIPDHATQILRRGRDYGDSRVICGAHSVSAVAAGRIAAAAIVARLHGDARFRVDLDKVRLEFFSKPISSTKSG